MYGFIYITTNNINGKKYIGQKNYDKYGKWKNYLGSGIHLKRAIKKYGRENFSREIIECCESAEQLDEREIYWIDYYSATKSKDYYNIAYGGDGGNTIYGYSDAQMEEYKKYKSELHKKTAVRGEDLPQSKLKEKDVLEIIDMILNKYYLTDIAKKYNISNSSIHDIYRHNTWTHLTKNIVFPNVSNRSKPPKKKVAQYDKEGNLLHIYESAREAELKTGVGYRLISAVCHGSKKSAHGYIWKFPDGENVAS